MVHLRKILFAIFVVLYLLICPSLILYSLGIMITPGKKSVTKTGVIYITSIPSGASITINGRPLKDETPTLINNLLPGTYNLQLSAENYRPWEAVVSVSPEKATPLENILLLPNPVKTAELSDQETSKLIAIEDNPFVIVTTGKNTKDIFAHIWDESFTQNILPERPARTPRLKPLFPPGPDQIKGRVTKIHSVASSPYLIFEIDQDGETKFVWTDPLLGTSKTEDITNLFPVTPQLIEWNQDDPRHLLSFQNNAINRIDLATKAVYPQIINHVVNFTNYEETIFFLTEDRTLLKTSMNSPQTNTRLVSTNPMFNDLIIRHFPFTKMNAVAENIVLLIGVNGELISNLKPYLLADAGIQGFRWNKRPQKALIWSRNRIGLIDFSKNTQDVIPSVIWLQEEGKEITNAYWINEGSHILFVDNDQVFMADTGCCGTVDVRKIVDIKRQSDVYYSERTGKMFFIHKDTGRLCSIEMIAQHALLPSVSKERPAKDSEE